MALYEVQHYTLCDGWINTWSIEDQHGISKPEVFTSFEDALSSLDEFLEDELVEFELGNIASPYIRDEFKIVKIERVNHEDIN